MPPRGSHPKRPCSLARSHAPHAPHAPHCTGQVGFNIIINELFPERYRARGSALGFGLAMFQVTLTHYLYPVSEKAVSMPQLLAILATITTAEAVAVWLLLPETKGVALADMPEVFRAFWAAGGGAVKGAKGQACIKKAAAELRKVHSSSGLSGTDVDAPPADRADV